MKILIQMAMSKSCHKNFVTNNHVKILSQKFCDNIFMITHVTLNKILINKLIVEFTREKNVSNLLKFIF